MVRMLTSTNPLLRPLVLTPVHGAAAWTGLLIDLSIAAVRNTYRLNGLGSLTSPDFLFLSRRRVLSFFPPTTPVLLWIRSGSGFGTDRDNVIENISILGRSGLDIPGEILVIAGDGYKPLAARWPSTYPYRPFAKHCKLNTKLAVLWQGIRLSADL
ncbi:hypothetical protein B0H11DRAFT_1926072 [Mycena galericulata]|nr:hypothetical protein B0H11DRAFT_1926072 [Mycena galericulata]